MEAFSPWHVLIVAVVAAVVFFGWRQLPEMSRSLGRSLRIFRTEVATSHREVSASLRDIVTDVDRHVTATVDAVRAPVPAHPESNAKARSDVA